MFNSDCGSGRFVHPSVSRRLRVVGWACALALLAGLHPVTEPFAIAQVPNRAEPEPPTSGSNSAVTLPQQTPTQQAQPAGNRSPSKQSPARQSAAQQETTDNQRPAQADHRLLAVDSFDDPLLANSGYGWESGWSLSQLAPAVVVSQQLVWPPGSLGLGNGRSVQIRGTGDRNNPLRRQLSEAFAGNELFVRFLIRYEASAIDQPGVGDGEFFVLWLDDREGSDRDTHSNNVPNLGLHVAPDGPRKNQSVFMIRIGVPRSAFSPVLLEGDRTFLFVGRLGKSTPGVQTPFDVCELWIDPSADDQDTPDARITNPQSLNIIRWLGFSTGRKTEPDDRIQIDDLAVGTSWEAILGLPVPNATTVPEPIPTEPVSPPVAFADDILPLLRSRCFECHAGAEPDSGVALDHLDGMLEHVVPGQSQSSPLLQLVTSNDPDRRMPPADSGDALSEQDIALLTRWIDGGLEWNTTLLPSPRPESDHWAFQPIQRPAPPQPAHGSNIINPVDAFLEVARSEAGVELNPQADPRTLIRRLSLDLTGLPPTPAEIQQFIDDSRPDAYERLVERLLTSPRYGERWGRFWLDLARWAESNGHQHNRLRPHAWRYRDYVVDSFNQNLPFDEFVTQQLAGDELVPYSNQNIIATGFLSAARYSGNELDKSIQRNDILVDIVNTTGSSLLGLTLECAQCHNHKTDPISARDYYRFQGFFLRAQPVNVILGEQEAGDEQGVSRTELIARRDAIFNAVHQRLVERERKLRPVGEILIIPKNVLKGMTSSERQQYDELSRQIENFPQTWAYYSPLDSARSLSVPRLEIRWPLPFDAEILRRLEPTLYIRGDIKSPGPRLQTGIPALFTDPQLAFSEEAVGEDSQATTLTTPRLQLAEWVTSPRNPLTARVWVNRLWQYHFGRGLVPTSSDFGVRTPRPPLHKLLDWMACELMESGWDSRHLHRLIVLSATYRASSTHADEPATADPENRLHWRWEPRRLESEALRDQLLAVTGELEMQIGGPSDDSADSRRRALYQLQKRDAPTPMQALFDGPNMVTSCSRRRVSTVALQPLYLLNHDFVRNRAARLANEIVTRIGASDGTRDGPRNTQAQLTWLFERVLGRLPSDAERESAITFLNRIASRHAGADGRSLRAWTDLCQVMLNLNEFHYIP